MFIGGIHWKRSHRYQIGLDWKSPFLSPTAMNIWRLLTSLPQIAVCRWKKMNYICLRNGLLYGVMVAHRAPHASLFRCSWHRRWLKNKCRMYEHIRHFIYIPLQCIQQTNCMSSNALFGTCKTQPFLGCRFDADLLRCSM